MSKSNTKSQQPQQPKRRQLSDATIARIRKEFEFGLRGRVSLLHKHAYHTREAAAAYQAYLQMNSQFSAAAFARKYDLDETHMTRILKGDSRIFAGGPLFDTLDPYEIRNEELDSI